MPREVVQRRAAALVAAPVAHQPILVAAKRAVHIVGDLLGSAHGIPDPNIVEHSTRRI